MLPATACRYDSYSFSNTSWLQPIAAYKRNIFPRLHPHQRVVRQTSAHQSVIMLSCLRQCHAANVRERSASWLTPAAVQVHVTTAFADPGYGERPAETAAEIDAFCVQNAEAFLSWALSEPRVAAIVPFHWETTAPATVGPNGMPAGHTGLGDRAVFPRCDEGGATNARIWSHLEDLG